MVSSTSVYWIYVIYALGTLGLWIVGHRKWWGHLLLVVVHLIFAVAGVMYGLTWLALGNFTYALVDLYNAYRWQARLAVEARLSQQFLDVMRSQFAEGKKEAILELLRIERDVQELARGGSSFPFGGGRRKEDQQIDSWLKEHKFEKDGDQP